MDDYSTILLAAAEEAVPLWLERIIRAAATDCQGDGVEHEMTDVIRITSNEILVELRELLELEVDEQATTPLAIVRNALRRPNEILISVGATPKERNESERQRFPDDYFGLVPGNWGDIDESLVTPAMEWGAHKAMQHMAKHK